MFAQNVPFIKRDSFSDRFFLDQSRLEETPPTSFFLRFHPIFSWWEYFLRSLPSVTSVPLNLKRSEGMPEWKSDSAAGSVLYRFKGVSAGETIISKHVGGGGEMEGVTW